ncbi:MAG: hypothetical protein JW888_04230 [Pirellulales bacterium]|nr:hypothetical protein [Pirellulales bacterium]
MRHFDCRVVLCSLSVVACLACRPAAAQQSTVAVPYSAANHGFHERMGVAWGIHGKGWNFSFGSPMTSVPVQGLAVGGGLHGGWAMQGKHGAGFVRFSAEQGSRRSLVSQTPMLNTTPGRPAWFFNGSFSPFVIGYQPVVGGYPVAAPWVGPAWLNGGTVRLPSNRTFSMGSSVWVPNGGATALGGVERSAVGGRRFGAPLARAGARRQSAVAGQVAATVHDLSDDGTLDLRGTPRAESVADREQAHWTATRQSSAARPAPGVAEARHLHAADKAAVQDEARRAFERGQEAERAGKKGAAKVYYQMALRKAHGSLAREIQASLDAMTAEKQ